MASILKNFKIFSRKQNQRRELITTLEHLQQVEERYGLDIETRRKPVEITMVTSY